MIDADAWDVIWDDDHDAYTMRFDRDGLAPSVAVAVILETALDAETGPSSTTSTPTPSTPSSPIPTPR
jgi:hypothetical protein